MAEVEKKSGKRVLVRNSTRRQLLLFVTDGAVPPLRAAWGAAERAGLVWDSTDWLDLVAPEELGEASVPTENVIAGRGSGPVANALAEAPFVNLPCHVAPTPAEPSRPPGRLGSLVGSIARCARALARWPWAAGGATVLSLFTLWYITIPTQQRDAEAAVAVALARAGVTTSDLNLSCLRRAHDRLYIVSSTLSMTNHGLHPLRIRQTRARLVVRTRADHEGETITEVRPPSGSVFEGFQQLAPPTAVDEVHPFRVRPIDGGHLNHRSRFSDGYAA